MIQVFLNRVIANLMMGRSVTIPEPQSAFLFSQSILMNPYRNGQPLSEKVSKIGPKNYTNVKLEKENRRIYVSKAKKIPIILFIHMHKIKRFKPKLTKTLVLEFCYAVNKLQKKNKLIKIFQLLSLRLMIPIKYFLSFTGLKDLLSCVNKLACIFY